MTSRTNPKVDEFLSNARQWREEIAKLRSIVLDCDLAEEVKWGRPCYALGGRNVVLIHGFKEYCALLFMKGALLTDPNGILIRQTGNVQAARQIRFTHLGEISALENVLKSYIHDAIAVERSGREVEKKTTKDFAVAEEFQSRLDGMPALKTAFQALTPGRQRAYLLHFSAPKQSKTREARVEKAMPRIIEGKGLDD